jgi:hypothetical protein
MATVIFFHSSTIKQKYACETERMKKRRFEGGGAGGKWDTIVLGKIELGGGKKLK